MTLCLLLSIAACGQRGTADPATSTAGPAGPAHTADAETVAATAPPAPPTGAATSGATSAPAATERPAPDPSPTATAPGALIALEMASTVGVLLDEFPEEMRERVATAVLEQTPEQWSARARRQTTLTRLRLNFRDFRYEGKGQLPLPPRELWRIDLDPAGPRRETIQGHDLVVLDYTFTSTLLTDLVSPGVAEPALAEISGVWEEPFVLPIDPDLLLQRTGNACINEAGFPPNSFDSENVWNFYDHACTAESGGALGCHRSQLPNFSCREALAATIGEVETAVVFERLDWDADLAERVRIGDPAVTGGADLRVRGEDLAINRVVYRFVEPDDCAVEEGAVGETGWRRLLLFDATIHNIGNEALFIGLANAVDLENHVFEYSACHDHFHYSNYGDFFIADAEGETGAGGKQAFCVQSTYRFSNNELSPLIHDFTCTFQGIQTGWGDEYIAGLDAQWVDITDVAIPDEGATLGLGFAFNRDRFLCEGQPVRDDDGELLWEPSGQLTEDGASVNRPQCEFVAGWDANNEAVHDVFVPASGSFVTEPCRNDEIGPRRNCGFTPLAELGVPACTPGTTVAFPVEPAPDADAYALRACPVSDALGGLACTRRESLANVLVAGPIQVAFTCPAILDGDGGGYALYAAPLWPEDPFVAPVVDIP